MNSPHDQLVTSALLNGFDYMAQLSTSLWCRRLSVFAALYMGMKCRPVRSMTTNSPADVSYFGKHVPTLPCSPQNKRTCP